MKLNKFIKNRPLIYGIRNLTNDKLYVGKTKCIYQRTNQYLYDFATERLGHLNQYLLSAMKKVGIENFEIFVLEFSDIENLAENELKWINYFDTTNRNKGYNLRLDSSTGMIVNAETSAKISKNLKAQWAAGVRKNHGAKLKESWDNASDQKRKRAGETLTKNITKFEYAIIFPDGTFRNKILYAELKELGLSGGLQNMSRSGLNETKCLNHLIRRIPRGES